MATLADRMIALHGLFQAGQLTEAEFARAKAMALNEAYRPQVPATPFIAGNLPATQAPVANAPSGSPRVKSPTVSGVGLALGVGAAAAASGGFGG